MAQQRIHSMTQGHPTRLLLMFALPLMVGNVFQQLYTVVDTAVVGQFVGVGALASLGAADAPQLGGAGHHPGVDPGLLHFDGTALRGQGLPGALPGGERLHHPVRGVRGAAGRGRAAVGLAHSAVC